MLSISLSPFLYNPVYPYSSYCLPLFTRSGDKGDNLVNSELHFDNVCNCSCLFQFHISWTPAMWKISEMLSSHSSLNHLQHIVYRRIECISRLILSTASALSCNSTPLELTLLLVWHTSTTSPFVSTSSTSFFTEFCSPAPPIRDFRDNRGDYRKVTARQKFLEAAKELFLEEKIGAQYQQEQGQGMYYNSDENEEEMAKREEQARTCLWYNGYGHGVAG